MLPDALSAASARRGTSVAPAITNLGIRSAAPGESDTQDGPPDRTSGFFGVYKLDRSPVLPDDLRAMAPLVSHRVPDGIAAWHAGSLGLGHALLATTHEARFERLPLQHTESGCMITADVCLDNRDELLATLGVSGTGRQQTILCSPSGSGMMAEAIMMNCYHEISLTRVGRAAA